MPVFNGGITNQQTGLLDPKLLQQRGPLLQIEVSVPDVLANKLYQEKKPIPPPVTGLGLLDTGASITGVDVNALQQLSLSMINEVTMNHPGGEDKQGIYACQISFPGTQIEDIEFSAALGSNLKGQGLLAILGRDVLKDYQLVYNGPGGFWTIAG